MEDDVRRHELGKMCLDVAKYVFTTVVIGGFVGERIPFTYFVAGIVLGAVIAAAGFLTIPANKGVVS